MGIMGRTDTIVMPTGITSLDVVLKGGIPTGSLILLLGAIGAGHNEFTHTSMLSLLKSKEDGHLYEQPENYVLPENICYISLTRGWEDVQCEMLRYFTQGFDEISNEIKFKDFSEDYFSTSSMPTGWATRATPSFDLLKEMRSEKELIEDIAAYLDENGENSLVVIDSITALAEYSVDSNHSIQWADIVSFFRGLQKVSKKWRGVIYALFTSNIFDNRMQEQIADCVDGVFVFEWMDSGTSRQQRVMHVKKFRGLLPHLEADNFVKFEVSINVDSGFSVSNIKQIAASF